MDTQQLSPLSKQAAAAQPADAEAARSRFLDYVADPAFPCVGAKSAANRKRIRHGLFGDLGGNASSEALCSALYGFLDEFESPGVDPVSFVAQFSGAPASETGFEAALWQQLQRLHDIDRRRYGWDATVSSDPSRSDFSFSIGGRGLFVVGLHPHASRMSRRAPAPTLVFNFHEQFERLRAAGSYDGLQRAVRKRDVALQGSINPVLARFGEASEAIQYAGRAVPADWRCPFRAGGPT